VTIPARHVLRQTAIERELTITSDKAASGHIHTFISYCSNHNISIINELLKKVNSRILLSEFPYLKEEF